MQGGTPAARGQGVRLFIFDFDQTLSVHHVFKALAGWGSHSSGFVIPAPHATTEIGQLARMQELSAAKFEAEGGFPYAAFGGKERVQLLQDCLAELRGSGAELMVCTKGLVGTVNKCLIDLDLRENFSQVYGRVSGSYGASAYDKTASVDDATRELLGSAEQADWRTKDKLMARLMAARGLGADQAVLVEDDPEEVRSATGVCRTLLVKEAAGLQREHLQQLLEMAAVDPAAKMPGLIPQRPKSQASFWSLCCCRCCPRRT